MKPIGPCALMLALLASTAQAQHPLDGLTAREHWAVYDVLRAAGHVDEKTRFASVQLREPPKAEVLAWHPGAPLRREAIATLIQGPRTFEAVVDVAGRKAVSWREIPGVQANLTSSEFELAGELMKKDADVIQALGRRGITDLATVECWTGSPGYFGTEEGTRRTGRGSCVDRHGVYNGDSRPIEGLVAVIDLEAKKILRVIDTGVVPVPKSASDYDAESLGRTRELPTPLSIDQPLGPAFKLEGQQVKWQGWSLHFRADPRRGLVVSTVRYQDAGRSRSILYQGSLSELFVPYMDPSVGWYDSTFLDLGEYPALGLFSSLEPGADCPDNAAYFDTTFAGENGIPRPLRRAACLFERSGGEPAWRHSAETTHTTESRARRDLVLRWVATIGNYDYCFDWVFQQDGSIRVGVGATGIVAVKAVPSRTAAKGGADDAYGRFVAENTVAVNHDHFFSFRLDLDVDGTANSFVTDMLEPQLLPKESLRRSLWVVKSKTARVEQEAERDMHDPSLWRFVSASERGPLGYPTSYQIRPGHSASSLLDAADYPQRRAGFTEHALWVTPYRSEELYAAGDYPTQSRGGDGLPAWTAANRPIEATDIVAWYTLGMHHVVRAEDWPVMPVVWHEFEIRPFDFFARNPALDLPKGR